MNKKANLTVFSVCHSRTESKTAWTLFSVHVCRKQTCP